MTDQHPITPPPELVRRWIAEIRHEGTPVRVAASDLHITTHAARWGADQELEACVNYVDNAISGNKARALRAARRPKPPSLAEEALDAAKDMSDWMNHGFIPKSSNLDTIRAALERLKELEGAND